MAKAREIVSGGGGTRGDLGIDRRSTKLLHVENTQRARRDGGGRRGSGQHVEQRARIGGGAADRTDHLAIEQNDRKSVRASDRIASVASFFVSRIDTAVDRELEKLANQRPEASDLFGKTGTFRAIERN